MAIRQHTGGLYEFGPYVLDTVQHVLSRQGEPIALTPKTYDLLLFLVENRGRMLAKDELMKALWPNIAVEESNLTQQISMIRRALGETAGNYRYIVTVPGRGYRFSGEVREGQTQGSSPLDKPAVGEPAGPTFESSAPETPTGPWWRNRVVLASAAFMLVGLIAFGYSVYRRAAGKNLPHNPVRTLAVLPFQSIGGDPKSDFLGFSLADAVITKLDYVGSLNVRASSAIETYRKQRIDIQRIASELHVDTLLTGNYIREGDDLRITYQLIDVRSQDILGKGAIDLKYERLLMVQDRVAEEIVKGLRLSLSPLEVERLKPVKAVDPAAYEYYLRGVDLYARNDFPTAIKMLQKSAEIDSGYALTWAQLGRALTANASFELGGREEYRSAQAAYEKALAIQPELIEARIYMANRFTDTGRVESAVPLLRDVASTSPNNAEVHWELGYAYRFAGMLREAVAECERARELDPGVKLSTSTPNAYLYLGQYDAFVKSLPENSSSALIVFYRGLGALYRGSREEAARDFDAAYDRHPSLLQARVGKAMSYGIRREDSKGLAVLRQTEMTIADRGVGDPEAIYKIAQAYAVLGDRNSALRVLRHSIENGFFCYPYFVSDPLLDSVRNESDFKRLLALARERHDAFKKRFFGTAPVAGR